MNLPSFIWLWKVAAWSMGFTIAAFLLLAVSGTVIFVERQQKHHSSALCVFHFLTGSIMVLLVLLLLGIGVVGTLGHFGSLGHSWHLLAGLAVVDLVFLSAWSAAQILSLKPWARALHIGVNFLLFIGFLWVSITGWVVVQKYLP